MDSGLLTVMEEHTGHFGVRRQLYSSPYRNPWNPRSSRGWPGATCRPPLWIWRFICPKPRPCGQGKAPSPRREWKPASRFPTNAAGIPHRWGSIRPRRFAGALQNSPESIKNRKVLGYTGPL